MQSNRSNFASAVARALALGATVAALFAASHASAQGSFGTPGGYTQPPPTTDAVPELIGVDILNKLNAQLPLETVLTNDDGRTVTLRDVLPQDRPAILQIGYMRCPQLCSLVMNALVRGMQGLDWSVGKEFDVISLSISPEEKAELASAKKVGYVAEYGRGTGGAGWHFMTGEEANIKRITDAVGFQFRKQDSGDYSHAAAIFLITPDGKLSRVLEGVRYEPATLRMGLLEASEGKIGTTIDRIILWCHVYDGATGGYVVFALRIMQIGGALTVLIMGTGVAWFLWREASRRRLAPPVHPATT